MHGYGAPAESLPDGGIKTEPRCTEQVEFKVTEAPRHYSATGYGARIPTRYMVKFNGKWRRVYCAIFSNVGTTYIGGRNGEPRLIVRFY